MAPHVRTERLELRLLRAEDRAEFIRVHRISEEHFTPWMPASDRTQTPDEAFEAELDRASEEWASGTGARWVAMLRDGTAVGFFSLSQVYRRSFQNAYAGWRVSAEQAGQGIATEGVAAMLDLAFTPEPVGLGLHRVQANIIPANGASVRVAEKAGFRLEGRAKAYLRINGTWQDHLMFAKTSEEHPFRYLDGGLSSPA